MVEKIAWSAQATDYLRTRSRRYHGALDIQASWTVEVLADPDLVGFEPDPKSRMGASRFIGESPSGDVVLVVIAYRDLDGDLHGINAWPATGYDLKAYSGGVDDGEED
ncbi:MAG: hypothetical protein ABI140_02825 [Jatrophihabitantaceae bacterium]